MANRAKTISLQSWFVEPLGSNHDRATFSCGNPTLDRYLKTQARQDARRNVAAPFVLLDKSEESTILGYYTLSAFGIELAELPPEVIRKLPNYPIVPATMIGRLAVDQNVAGQGFGEILLMDALHRCWRQSSKIASAAVVVDAIDESAVAYYRHFGFLVLPDRPDRLFLQMKSIAGLFREQ